MGSAVSDSFCVRKSNFSVWRVAVLWQDAVLDVVTVRKKRARFTLRTGDVLTARVVNDQVLIDGPFGELTARDGELVALPAGHALLVHEDIPAENMPGLYALDSTLFHAAMIGAAVQAVFVSALVLTPTPVFDPDAGAGWTGELRRLVVAPGGTAARRGAPSVSAVGRIAEEGEKRTHERSAGTPVPSRAPPRQTSEEALAAMREALKLGDGGAELKDALGELARSVASAPELGAGVGGLMPRDPIAPGTGNGLIGPGQSKLAEMLRKRILERELKPETRLQSPERKPIGPVQLMDVPHGEVTLDEALELDPLVRDEIARAVRRRHNAIRHCYESWGLAADADRSGKLTLELTLMPNGRVVDASAHATERGLVTVGECVARMAGEWYLGDGLVDVPTRLAFPFVLKPRAGVTEFNFDAP
jgi:hypothetical protein